MSWHDIVSRVKEKLRRGAGGRGGHDVELAAPGTRLEPLGDAPLETPAVDIYENDRELLIQADVPGGSPEGTMVAWDEARGLTFVVHGQGLPEGTLRACEAEPRDWVRALQLPDHVDGAKATCTIKDGVLTIRAPKRATAVKRIPVRAR